MNRLFFSLLILLGIVSFSPASLAKIDLQLDRNNIREKETFELTLLVENPATLTASQNLQFLPPEFQVISSQRFQKSTVINGKFANRMGWSLQLISNSAGTFTLPAFTIGNESSDNFTIRILPALDELEDINPNSKIKLSSSISEEQVYVQQQILYTVRIYSSVPTRRRSITPLQVPNAVVHKLDDAAEFQMVSKGVTYNVLEEKYVIFPQQSGELKIPPIQFRTNIIDTDASFSSLSRYRPIELQSQPFSVNVKTKPESAIEPWIPAKSIELKAEWQPANQTFEVGTPASLDFIIKGVALLPEQLPEIVFPEVEGLKLYRDKPNVETIINANGVNSYHLEKLAVIPSQAGTLEIPEIRVPYWDTTQDQQAYAVLPKITLQVAQQTNTTALPAFSTATNNPQMDTSTLSSATDQQHWKLATLVFAALWLATSLLLWARWRSSPAKVARATTFEEAKDSSGSQKVDLSALKSTSDPQQASAIILSWAASNSANRITNLDELTKNIKSEALAAQLKSLQVALYGGSNSEMASNWQGSSLFTLLNQESLSKPSKSNKDGLAPLYPE
ncbi:BatD family protein [Kangiella sp. TOML190]|uniref:BatD family protein n=1 Tax=Kangiella sp. TOML190 TaxID=2931351 RepID=UPI00203DB5AF|nr:BatD family protein [Kangiella sp. TOML190]